MKNEATKMIKTPQSLIRVAVFCLPLALVASCGGSEAITGSTITINPALLSQPSSTAGSRIEYFEITVKSPSGVPQVGVKITLLSPYFLYLRPSEGSCDTATTQLLTSEVTTDAAGTYGVCVFYGWAAAATGTVTALKVWSGPSYGKADITFAP